MSPHLIGCGEASELLSAFTYLGTNKHKAALCCCTLDQHDIVAVGSGRVDMFTSPVAAARAAVATVAWVKSKHDMYLIRGLIRGSVGA